MEFYYFDGCKSNGKKYNGDTCIKDGYSFDGVNCMLKMSKKPELNSSYEMTAIPLSEYIGSHIYSILGFDAQKTMLGALNGTLTVACVDFLSTHEKFHSINEYIPKVDVRNSTYALNLNYAIHIMRSDLFSSIEPKLEDQLWNMFIVDSFIGNPDRTGANWGIVQNTNNKTARPAPIFDNGKAFFSQLWSTDESIMDIIGTRGIDFLSYPCVRSAYYLDIKEVDNFYQGTSIVFPLNMSIETIQEIRRFYYIENKKSSQPPPAGAEYLNPFDVMCAGTYPECTKAIIKIVPLISYNINKISKLINLIPSIVPKHGYGKIIVDASRDRCSQDGDSLSVLSEYKRNFMLEVVSKRLEVLEFIAESLKTRGLV